MNLFALIASKVPPVIPETASLLFPEYQVNTLARKADFIAQTAHESALFTRFEENLNYSAQGLANTWPKRYQNNIGKPNTLALSLHRNPQLIANNVYANRMGNVLQGDGWLFRGRGMLQLTGRTNYETYGKLLNLPLLAKPDMAADPGISLRIALEFYKQRKVFSLVDAGKTTAARVAINGGTNGLDEVNRLRTIILKHG